MFRFRPLVSKKLLSSIRTRGVCKTLFWIWFGCFGWNVFDVYVKDGFPDDRQDDDDSLSLEVADAGVVTRIQESPDFQTPEAFISQTLTCSQCLIGFINRRPAHVMWVFREGDDSRFFNLDAAEAEINYCYTPPRFRGQGVYQQTLRAAVRHLQQQGISRIYMAVHHTNISSQRAIAKAGFRHAGRLNHFGLVHRPKWGTVNAPTSDAS